MGRKGYGSKLTASSSSSGGSSSASGNDSTAESFKEFRSNLELTDQERTLASEKQKELREMVRDTFVLDSNHGDFLSGSYGKNTAIHPLHDVDIFAVLDEGQYGVFLSKDVSARRFLNHAKRELEAKHGDQLEIRVQNRSLGIQFKNSDVKTDFVPALPHPDGGYQIPDKASNSFIRTDPKMHRIMMTNRNKELGGELVPTIKVAKAWNENQRDGYGKKPLGSTHLQTLLVKHSTKKEENSRKQAREALRVIEKHGHKPLYDPANPDALINSGYSERRNKRIRQLARRDGKKIDRALKYEVEGKHEKAKQIYREVFGEEFPE